MTIQIRPQTSRLNSVDALRGLTVAAMLLVNNAGDWNHVYPWLSHAHWHGVQAADYIFPFFLVIVGLSLSLALSPALESGKPTGLLLRSVLWRGLKLFILGVALHVFAMWVIPDRSFRLMGVLQRIAIVYVLAGVLFLFCRAWVLYLIFAAILLGYWALLASGSSYEIYRNFADGMDGQLLRTWAYQFDVVRGVGHDPEGLLSSIPATASVLMGVYAALCLRTGQLVRLVLVGVSAMLVAALWDSTFPMNKALWTSSFVLWTGGAAYLVIALTHVMVDRWHWPAVGMSLGINAIAAYALAWVLSCVLAGSGAMAWIEREILHAYLNTLFAAELSSFLFAVTVTLVIAAGAYFCRLRRWRWSI